MRSQHKSIEIPLFPPRVQGSHIRKKVVDIVTIRRILLRVPLLWSGEFAIQPTLDFGFVVDRVEAYDPLEENVQFWVRGRVFCYFEEGLEDI